MMTLVIIAVVVGAGLVWYGKGEFEKPGSNPADTTFEVKANTSLNAISFDLQDRGLVSNGRIFELGVRAAGKDGKLKAGEYAIKAGSTMRAIMDVLASGKSIMYSMTIPEGWTVAQALAKIGADPVLAGDLPATPPAEGSLVADTILFARGMTRAGILDKMAADQTALVEKIWATRAADLPVKDINEFVTLASIVEKETGIATERPHVASVFVNRLKKGMKLQSDPTIIYGLFGGAGKPADRPIYQSDIAKETPYNTYVIPGLPPTPIANPGKAALEAVANPAQTEDLYFVADGTGGHAFASTLEEHNANVEKWRAIEKQRAEEKAGAPANGSGSTNQ
ncbi:MAG: endolytic transglycosylase MltG [Phyllobacteriaceae bacterium]|nr:endolytic transglycosylase MltG [Phyllobacteriaceae bacterium]